MDIIRSKDNNKIKYIRSLKTKKFRDEENAFLVEGIKFVNEAIKEGAAIKFLLISEKLKQSQVTKLINLVDESIVFLCTEQVFASAADTVTSQGVLAVIEKRVYKDNILNELNFIIFCDRLQDPGNLGTILRTADAFGPAALVLNKGCVDIFNPKVVRASAGSIFRVPLIYGDLQFINLLKEEGFYIVSTVVNSQYSFENIENKEKICLVIGNEGQGVSREIIDSSHRAITIEMPGRAESLNASVAAGISIYEIRKKLL
ncbi:MAG: RNA methyltransferase [Tissierellia bacterium]|nr:RNA methyltransferase [Tissierellia bacterium]